MPLLESPRRNLCIQRKPSFEKEGMHTAFIAALSTIAKTREATKCPSNRGMGKDAVHVAMEYYSGIKDNEIMPSAATWMT